MCSTSQEIPMNVRSIISCIPSSSSITQSEHCRHRQRHRRVACQIPCALSTCLNIQFRCRWSFSTSFDISRSLSCFSLRSHCKTFSSLFVGCCCCFCYFCCILSRNSGSSGHRRCNFPSQKWKTALTPRVYKLSAGDVETTKIEQKKKEKEKNACSHTIGKWTTTTTTRWISRMNERTNEQTNENDDAVDDGHTYTQNIYGKEKWCIISGANIAFALPRVCTLLFALPRLYTVRSLERFFFFFPSSYSRFYSSSSFFASFVILMFHFNFIHRSSHCLCCLVLGWLLISCILVRDGFLFRLHFDFVCVCAVCIVFSHLILHTCSWTGIYILQYYIRSLTKESKKRTSLTISVLVLAYHFSNFSNHDIWLTMSQKQKTRISHFFLFIS